MINRRANTAHEMAPAVPPNRRGSRSSLSNPERDSAGTGRTEDELRRSEQHLRAIIENTPECIKIVACDGTIVSMNAAGLRLVEADSPDDVVGRCVLDLIAPEFRTAYHDLHQKVCAGLKGELEYELVGLRGGRRWLHTRAAPIPHPTTGEAAHLAVTSDITERRLAEQTIRFNEERLRELIEGLPAAVYTTDAAGRITMFNQAAVEFSGRVPQIGTDCWCVCLASRPMPDGRRFARRSRRARPGSDRRAARRNPHQFHSLPHTLA
jgi:PAS domain S-box-containing protein